MANKTVLEKQIQAYGQFQSTIRKMSKEDQIRYASEGPLAKQREKDKLDLETRRAEYAKELKNFDKEKPMFGNLAGLTPEEVAKISEISKNWAKKRKAFDKELRQKYGFDAI
jgi:hypothetical protein